MGRSIPLLIKVISWTVAVFLLNGSIVSAQDAGITRRVMTEQEFTQLKAREGVYDPGRHYNILIDGHGTGLRPPTAEEWQRIRRTECVVDKIHGLKKAAPPSHDNSQTIWFPPIGTQDGEGSCVSWACGYYTKTFQEAKEHNWDLSRCVWEDDYYGHPSGPYQDQIFSPDFIYHQVNNGEDNGSNYFDNMNLLERVGCCTWDRMPYDPTDTTTWPSEDAWRQAPWYRSETGYTLMWVQTDSALEDLKDLLADTNLVVISINAYYYDSLTSEDLWTVDNYSPVGTNHANTVVGYDDNHGPYVEEGDPNAYGAFKVANSWLVGGWENVDDGFYYISYECMKHRIASVMLYQNRVDYEPEVVSVFQLSHDHRGECETMLGIGDINSPDSIKPFDQYDNKGGSHPFPSHRMVMDITELLLHTPDPLQCFLGVYDGGTDAIGSIDFFSIEIYDDYGSGVPIETHVCPSPPVSTVNLSSVYAAYFPAIRLVGSIVDDSAGDDDGNADPGETVELSVVLQNLGLGATSVSGVLGSEDPDLSILTPTAVYGDIASGEERTSLAAYRCSVGVGCPDPHVATLELTIATDGGYSSGGSLYMGIGDDTGFFDDMESGIGGWKHRDLTFGYCDEWHQSVQRSQSGATSWKFGSPDVFGYSNRADGGLVSAPFLLGSGSRLSFWHWIDAETEDDTIAWDGAVVMLSVNNGAWVQVSPALRYPYTIRPNPASPFEPGTPCFSGAQDWDSVEFDLSGYEGVAQLRFRFGSDGFVTEEGWYIDDVVITSGICGDCNGDEKITVADAIYLVAHIYRDGDSPIGDGDVNDDGRLTIADAVYVVAYIYRGGAPPK